MENNIILKIGTVFNGEGMQKLATATKEANASIRQSSQVASKLTSAFTQMDTSGSKCATAITGLIGAFTNGGVQGAIFAGVVMSINAYFDAQKKKAEELKERVKEMGDQVMRTFSSTLTSQVNAVTNEVNQLTKSFDQATAAAAALSAAANAYANSNSTGNIITLEIQKFQAVLDATSVAEAKHAEAAYNLKIQEEKNSLANDQAAQKVNEVSTALAKSREREALIAENKAKIEEELTHLQETLAGTSSNQREVQDKLNAEIQKLSGNLQGLENDLTAQRAKTEKLVYDEATALQNMTNVRNQGVLALKQLEAAEHKSAIAEEEAAAQKQKEKEQSEILAAKKAEEANTRDDLRLALDEERNAQTKAKEAASELAEAEKNLEKAIEEYEKNFVRNETNKAVGDAKDTSGLKNIYGVIQQQIPKIAEAAKENAIKQGIANGKIQSVDDATRIGNEAQKAAAKEAHEIAVKQANEALRQARLEKMSEKAMSDYDKKWLETRKLIEEEKKKQADLVETAKQAKEAAAKKLEEAQNNQKSAADSLKIIKDKLEKLGLK